MAGNGDTLLARCVLLNNYRKIESIQIINRSASQKYTYEIKVIYDEKDHSEHIEEVPLDLILPHRKFLILGAQELIKGDIKARQLETIISVEHNFTQQSGSSNDEETVNHYNITVTYQDGSSEDLFVSEEEYNKIYSQHAVDDVDDVDDLLLDGNSIPLAETSRAKHLATPIQINWHVLGGFMATLGVAAVAIAFTALNAASFGIAGLAVATIGAAVALAGMGLFAVASFKPSNKPCEQDNSLITAASR